MKNDIFFKFCKDVEQMVSLLPGFKKINSQVDNNSIKLNIEHLATFDSSSFQESVSSTIKFWLNTQEVYQDIDFDTNIEFNYLNLIPKKKLTRTVVCPDCDKTFYYQMVTHCTLSNCTFKTV